MDYERLLGNSNGEPMHRCPRLFRKRRKKLMRAAVVLSCLALLAFQLPLQTVSQRQVSGLAAITCSRYCSMPFTYVAIGCSAGNIAFLGTAHAALPGLLLCLAI